MTTETQATIAEWAEKAFGPAPNDARIIARVNEEFAELLRAVTSHQLPEKIAEEAADVVIVLCRFAQLRKFDLFDMAYIHGKLFAGETPLRSALMHMHMLIDTVMFDQSDPWPADYVAGKLVASLARYLRDNYDLDLRDQIDKKMAINRKREWRQDDTRHGYHVREDGPTKLGTFAR